MTFNSSSWDPISVESYQRMVEVGILTADDKVELLENRIVIRVPEGPRHATAIQLVDAAIIRTLPTNWRSRVRLSLTLADSQPEPDLAIVRGDARSYLTRHPGPADVGTLIEAADSSLLRDQYDKTRIYARGNIPYYWIVNLVDRRVEVFSQPSGPAAVPAYGSYQIYQPGDQIPLVLDGATVGTVAAVDLLP